MTESSGNGVNSGYGSEASWDPVAITRQRADECRTERDGAIAVLRTSMSDGEILTDFGIDLDQIEE
ncbi:hypothetical protein [Microlunatus sp. Gsoil 973]|uniref:hypothetical protein n=1 Tax=Microlunatus sp. Gsoil 973 TaxID=2672569 RepID=UPI0012B458E4|nr:hypothetical protein [Microlunatus sp. Gsoil 973]QGN34493.1 hypothetical protein GJV80_18600 [Microlunatus sp. Gsoil 973]